jgi:hypothetical protein
MGSNPIVATTRVDGLVDRRGLMSSVAGFDFLHSDHGS